MHCFMVDEIIVYNVCGKVRQGNTRPSHFIHHKFHIYLTGAKPGPP
jgi:hypothetical protein